jgi:small-conductance mechanosensitive channel
MIDEISSELSPIAEQFPQWVTSAGVFAAAIGIAFALHRYLFRFLTRVVAERGIFWRSLVSRTERPTMMLVGMFAMILAAPVAPLTEAQETVIQRLLIIGLIILFAQVASAALHVWMTLHLRRYKLDSDSSVMARKHVTQSRILKRVADILIVVVAIGTILMTFESVRQYGVSLLASAGAAGIIIGLSLQTVLKNLLAGIQIAITQPIRLEDVVIVEGEWGHIEEITSTYVVIRIWDWRRLVVPLSYFIEQPFENWSRDGTEIMGTVTINLDYTTPVSEVREKAQEIVEGSSLWDRQIFGVQVIGFDRESMQVRVLMSATNAGNAWELRCLVREELVTWLQAEYPAALPRTRLEVEQPRAGANRDEANASETVDSGSRIHQGE